MDTIYRTFLHVRPPLDIAYLRALRNHPYVDYLAPSFTNGILLREGSERVNTAATESRPWGIDTVRAQKVWSAGVAIRGAFVPA